MEPQDNSVVRMNHSIGETEALYHEIAWKFGLSDSTMSVLYTIAWMGSPCLLGEIVRVTGRSKQTINSALRKLEHDGMLAVESFHGKKKIVRLTSDGEKLAERTVGRLLKLENEIFDAWSPKERTQYAELLQRYVVDLKEKMKEL